MFKPLLLAGAVLAFGAAASSTSAIEVGMIATGRSELTVQVAEHECVRDEKGWHYMEKDRRRNCRPARPEGKDWTWKCEAKRCGWWHKKENRWNDA